MPHPEITYCVISNDPFIVEYQHRNGLSKRVQYAVMLLRKEIEAEMPYITFDELTMRVKKYGDEMLLLEGHNILCNLPIVK